jgi:hypothetical protein
MSLKKNKTVVAPVTTESMMESMAKRFDDDIASLTAQRESALNVFRATATKLQTINENLNNCISGYDKMLAYIQSKKDVAQKSLADNTVVRNKIIDIIGE